MELSSELLYWGYSDLGITIHNAPVFSMSIDETKDPWNFVLPSEKGGKKMGGKVNISTIKHYLKEIYNCLIRIKRIAKSPILYTVSKIYPPINKYYKISIGSHSWYITSLDEISLPDDINKRYKYSVRVIGGTDKLNIFKHERDKYLGIRKLGLFSYIYMGVVWSGIKVEKYTLDKFKQEIFREQISNIDFEMWNNI